ncbi:MAG: hypothetical protein IT381_08140 [Deltaproteobacteria bacterium]|nr:hypothetical protein [Deltaproteobacteria bacterium]
MVTELLRDIDPDKFRDIVLQSPKQVREMIFDRLAIKKKPTNSTKFVKPGEKNEERLRELFSKLKEEEDDEVAEELLRNYFLKRRDLLADALDAIGVPHQHGLTDHELDKFEKLSKAEAEKLLATLSKKHDAFDAKLYLKYMKAPV